MSSRRGSARRILIDMCTVGDSKSNSAIIGRVGVIWNKEADLVVEIEVDEPAWQGNRRCNLESIGRSDQKRRIPQGPNESMRWKAIRQHQNQEWGRRRIGA